MQAQLARLHRCVHRVIWADTLEAPVPADAHPPPAAAENANSQPVRGPEPPGSSPDGRPVDNIPPAAATLLRRNVPEGAGTSGSVHVRGATPADAGWSAGVDAASVGLQRSAGSGMGVESPELHIAPRHLKVQ